MRIDLEEMNELHSKHLVTLRKDPFSEYVIANYTEDVTYGRLWEVHPLLKECRGLIYNQHSGTVLGKPWKKFKNVGEDPHTSLEDLLEYSKIHGNPEKSIKADGSLIILWHEGDPVRWRLASRGSFESDQVKWATSIYQEKGYENKNFFEWRTYLFELIYPTDRKVVDYKGIEDLLLIGMVETATGYEFSYADVIKEGQRLGIPTTLLEEEIPLDSLSSQALSNFEGWVLYWPEEYPKNGLRIKIKLEEYVRLHRALMGLSEKAIWEILASGKTSGLDDLIMQAPDELTDWTRKVEKKYRELYKKEEKEILWTASRVLLMHLDTSTREGMKEIALRAKEMTQDDPSVFPFLMNLAKGKPIERMLWERIKPEGTQKIDGIGQLQVAGEEETYGSERQSY